MVTHEQMKDRAIIKAMAMDLKVFTPLRDKQHWECLSSDGIHAYLLTLWENSIVCSCPSGRTRGVCYHIEGLKQKLGLEQNRIFSR